MALEELDCSFVLLGRAPGLERTEISSLAGLRVLFSGEQSVFA
jgi:hypothetical protein